MIEEVIQQIAAELHPSSGDNLTGFIIDTDHLLINNSQTNICTSGKLQILPICLMF